MKCHRCQQEKPPQAKFCLECGAPFKVRQERGASAVSSVDLHRALSDALEQQAATSEILRVISRSQADVQPAFDTIVANAVNLCAARMGAVYRFDGQLLHLVAHHNYPPEVLRILQEMHPRAPQLDQASGRAVLTRAVAQIEDMLADPLYAIGGLRRVHLRGLWLAAGSLPAPSSQPAHRNDFHHGLLD